MTKIPSFSAIIFDMDGLILDTETAYLMAWQQAVEAMNYPYNPALFLSLWGMDLSIIKELLLDHYGSRFNLKQFQQLSGVYWLAQVQQHGIEKKLGVESLLRVIHQRQIPYCLATNSPEKTARECLVFAGLSDMFRLIISGDDVLQSKPAPDIFLKAAEKLQQPIEHCLILEDSVTGLTAAHRSGAYTFFIPSQKVYKIDASFKNYQTLGNLTNVIPFICHYMPS
jgi:HAD superfamily hydrolase (TIGR01509 family)